MIQAFKYGLSTGFNQWRTALIGYVLQLLVAIVFGMQVYQVVEASIGDSLQLDQLLTGFNDSTVTDFINVHGGSITPLLGQLRYLILLYFIFSVFINAGILFAIVNKQTGWSVFWKGGATYFFRFFLLSVFYVVLFSVWTGLVLVPYLSFMMPSLEVFSSEKITVFLLFADVFFWLLGVVYIFNASVVARFSIIEENKGNWAAIKKGLGSAFRKFFSLNGLFFLFLLLQLLVTIIYWFAEGASGMISPLLILLFFFIQQGLVFLRWIFRIGMYGGIYKYINR